MFLPYWYNRLFAEMGHAEEDIKMVEEFIRKEGYKCTRTINLPAKIYEFYWGNS
jgi:hypothetical protein